MTEQEAIEQRRKYIEAWNTTMVKIWQDRIMALGVFDTHRRNGNGSNPHLFDSLKFFPVSADGEFMEFTLSHQFLEYGLYQDFGVGAEKNKGNPGDIGQYRADGITLRKIRERRKWFSTAYYASCMNIKDFMSVNIGREFAGIISDVFERMDKA